MNELQITQRYNDGVVILDLDGNILLGQTSDKLHTLLAALAFEDKKRVLLNLEKVVTVDSTGLGTIVGGYTRLSKQGGQLKVENLSARNLELMHITKLYTVVEIFDHEATALESFQHPYRLTPLASSARIRSSLETDR